jgi:putrescine transport system permease protein
MTQARLWRAAVIGLPGAWLALFVLAPLAAVIAISLAEPEDGAPPFALALAPTAFRTLIEDDLYIVAFANSLRIAASATLICLLIGYPMALAIARASAGRRAALLLLVMVPFWTSFLVRVYAWSALLRPTGIVNTALLALGLTEEPLPIFANEFAVLVGLVYSYLPFMVLPLVVAIERIDPALVEAAADLGARPGATLLRVVVPLSWPGIAAGCALVFIPGVGEFVIPDLLGGPDAPMIGRVLWNEFFANRDWPTASAIAVVLLAVVVPPAARLQRRFAPRMGRP